MLKTILIAILVLIAAVLLFAATRPDSFRVERSIAISAPPGKIFPLIDDFHQWPLWSPWENIDPQLQRVYGGAVSGTGATYAWEGNNKVGSGRMEIIESAPPERIRIQLDFLKPFEVHNTAEFTVTDEGSGSRVNWAMYGPSPYMAKLMGLFASMDKMVGKDFEKGLSQLKATAEK
jgi:uncharacterized protein YndB with AHSA1/START domain